MCFKDLFPTALASNQNQVYVSIVRENSRRSHGVDDDGEMDMGRERRERKQREKCVRDLKNESLR